MTRRIAFAIALCALAAPARAADTVVLKGHLLTAPIAKAKKLPPRPEAPKEAATITVVLNYTRPAEFETFAREQERAIVAGTFHPLPARELTARFGPTQQAYDDVLAYFQKEGFTLAQGSANRLTITLRGTRAAVEHAFTVKLVDYQLGKRVFFANDREPSLPRALAPIVRAIFGLSSYPRLRHVVAPTPPLPSSIGKAYGTSAAVPDKALGAGGLDGSGAVVALPELATFVNSDITDFLSSASLPASLVNRVHETPLAGGTQALSVEVALDIQTILGYAPGVASITVLDAPPTTDVATMVNGAINAMPAGAGARLMSVSYAECETDFTTTQLDTAESLFVTANMNGISIFSASGDTGNQCVTCDNQGNCNNANGPEFPASLPHAIAVGGTTLQVDNNNNWQSEAWCNTNVIVGGFNTSTHFARPTWQTAFTNSAKRSIPDVAADADAATGFTVCFSGCTFPGNGTSMATPIWAATWAMVAQASVPPRNVATVELIYSLANSAFHTPANMTAPNNDFAHVGRGSPNLAGLIPECGQKKDEPCCKGTTCVAAFSCAQGQCECGGDNEPCCNGNCGPNLVCTNNVCTCGGNNQPCCLPNQTCSQNFTCTINDTCHCGDVNQACCSGTTCNSNLLVCSAVKGNVCISACGHKGEQCCHSDPSVQPPTHAGAGPGWCYSGEGISCTGDTCGCGGLNQMCCHPGSTCGFGLTCANLICIKPNSGGSTCSTCNANLTLCQKGCALDPAHKTYCDCLCQVQVCDCRKQNNCGIFCANLPTCNYQ
jgi:hypothetical protein